MQTKIKIIFYLFIAIIPIFSCKKYLDKKPVPQNFIPTTLKDLQALLDNDGNINSQSLSTSEILADNYYLTTSDWLQYDRLNIYIWNKDATSTQWTAVYNFPVYYSNIILDQLPTIKYEAKDSAWYNSIKGAALFIRAFAFWHLVQVFCNPYSSTSNTDLGLVLKMESSITTPVHRVSVQQTYDQIIADLKLAANLLPTTSSYNTRPSKAAIYGALARIYISMRDYKNAALYADMYLQITNSLFNYNNLSNPNINTPFYQIVNPEVVYYDGGSNEALLDWTVAIVDTTLYNSYDNNDLRKSVYYFIFNGNWRFKGSYAGEIPYRIFTGIATDEIYLIRAECYARAGNKDAAIADLNTLMINRWKNNGSWVAFTAVDAQDALNKILKERRKELAFRGSRWSDLRRFNLEGTNITLTRFINNNTYTLSPNDLRWTLLIPSDEVNRSGIQQNPR